jgi:FkbM family methyltransferase
MSTTRDIIGKAVLRAPSWMRSIRKVPVLGRLVHELSHRILPTDKKVWAQIQAGPASGLWLQLNPRVADGFIRGGTESAMQKVISERLQPGMVFFDLGANIGLFTLLAARTVGESGKVFSFEPDQQNAARLRENIARNSFRNVTVVEGGVWSTTGELNFVPGPPTSPDRAWGKFVPGVQDRDGVATRCVSLDDFIRDAPVPDAIKCDVEGAEVEALRGGEKLLSKHHPWILCEMHSPENNRSVREFLGRLNYQIETIDETHLLAVAVRH